MSLAITNYLNTPDGTFIVLTTPDSIVLASGWTDSIDQLVERIRRQDRPTELRTDATVTRPATEAVDAYYSGDFSAINLIPVRQFGTELQLTGWAALRQIRPGFPLSYSEFATKLGRPTAIRAAASICARNAPALFVPCHRVLRGDGTLGGFAWGLSVKRSLLDREAWV